VDGFRALCGFCTHTVRILCGFCPHESTTSAPVRVRRHACADQPEPASPRPRMPILEAHAPGSSVTVARVARRSDGSLARTGNTSCRPGSAARADTGGARTRVRTRRPLTRAARMLRAREAEERHRGSRRISDYGLWCGEAWRAWVRERPAQRRHQARTLRARPTARGRNPGRPKTATHNAGWQSAASATMRRS